MKRALTANVRPEADDQIAQSATVPIMFNDDRACNLDQQRDRPFELVLHGTDGPLCDRNSTARRQTSEDPFVVQQLSATLAAIQAIPTPFDQAIKGDDSAPGRQKVLAAIRALQTQTETIVEVATLLGIQLNLE